MSHLPPYLLVGLTLVTLSPQPTFAEGTQPKAEELLARYQAFVDGLRVIGYDSQETEYTKGGPFADWTWRGFSRTSFVRAGGRWRLRNHWVGFSYHQRPLPIDLESESTFDGKAYLILNRDDRGARSLSSMDQESARRRLGGGGSGPVETEVVAEVDAVRPAAPNEYATKDETGVLYG